MFSHLSTGSESSDFLLPQGAPTDLHFLHHSIICASAQGLFFGRGDNAGTRSNGHMGTSGGWLCIALQQNSTTFGQSHPFWHANRLSGRSVVEPVQCPDAVSRRLPPVNCLLTFVRTHGALYYA